MSLPNQYPPEIIDKVLLWRRQREAIGGVKTIAKKLGIKDQDVNCIVKRAQYIGNKYR